MADLIKKIKIKKQDGTFTDYIPIGAEAQNISTNDGDSVQLKLNKKPYYYNSIADMKADTKLKTGDMAITLGYYEPNDGGNGEYKVVSGNYTDDGGSYHKLNNNLFAELIIKDNQINIKQFGAYGDGVHNERIYFLKAIDIANTIYIPKGTYLINEEITLNKSITFYGDGCHPGRSNYAHISTLKTSDNYAFGCSWGKSCVFKDLDFNGKGINMPIGRVENCSFSGSIGIYYARCRVDKCYFSSEIGIQKAVDSVITNCTFGGCNTALDFQGSNDNRVINNRIDWNELGIYMRDASYNLIEGNIFDRNSTYAIDLSEAPWNIFSGNNFERNLLYHVIGKSSYCSWIGNRFQKKRITDDSSSTERLPLTCFNFSVFGHTIFVGNNIDANKMFNITPNGDVNTNTFSGNLFNDGRTDIIKQVLGTVTIPANSNVTKFFNWNDISYYNCQSGGLAILNLEISNSKDNQIWYNGNPHITNFVNTYYSGITISLENPFNEEVTFTISTQMFLQSPWRLEQTNSSS